MNGASNVSLGLLKYLAALFMYLSGFSIAIRDESYLALRSYWIDDSGTATFVEARRADFKSYEGSLAKGYSSAALWLKIRVPGRVDGEPIALVITPTFPRHLELYDPDIEGYLASPKVSGRDASINDENHIGLDNGFVIPSTVTSRDIYNRVTTAVTLTVQVSVLRYDLANRNSLINGGAQAIYFAFVMASCLLGLVNWGVCRESLYGHFAFCQFYFLIHIFAFFGALRFFFGNSITADMRDFSFLFVTCTIVLAAAHFDLRRLCCTNGVRDSSCESSVVAGLHEQTHTPRLQDQELARVQ